MTYCRRCGTESSVFWFPYAFGCPPGTEVPADAECTFYLCDRCAHELALFMDIDNYMLKERME